MPLVLQCPSCGAEVGSEQRFCGQCAAPLAATSTTPVALPAQPGPSQSENRQVSVLFVDLVGFTTLSESRDPEDVRELLSKYFDTTRTIIGRYGGVVEKFIGDAVMAVWGAPTAREDDAERAVRAALDVVESVATFGAEIDLPLSARGGVVTGAVAAWTAPGEGLVAGDRVNTAARVQSVAEPGSVYVDEETRRSTSAAIAYVDMGEHSVKGKAEPLHLWRADRIIAGVGGSQRVDGLEAPFIGRDADLRLVKELFHACVERQSARLVSVVGVAGVGKSRLHWEFDKYVDGLVDDVWYHSGHCLSYGDGVAYWALAEMVRQRFQIAEEDTAEVAVQRLTDGLPQWVSDAAEREFLLPRLGALIGATDTTLMREELFAGWRLLFERLAETQTVILTFEDMQWADSGLLDFIEHLLDWAADAPIFVITFARPELTESRPGWPAGRRNATSLYLEALAPADMSTLLDHLVADLPTSLRDRIVERSEGIPLYAVETVRSLIDRDVVVPKDGVYRLVEDVGDLDVPSTLTSLIAARIDALPPDQRTLIKQLAVLGGSFPRASAAAVCGLSEQEAERLLSDLVRKEFLAVRTDKLSPDRGQYVFAQSLLRTVAYDMLSKRERKSLHLAVASHLRATFENDGDDLAEVIAAHYRDALMSAENDDDAGDIRREALTAYGRAGRRAATLGAPETALAIYRTAADLAEEPDERLLLRERAADMALRAGRHQETFDLYRSLREEHAAAGHERDWARLSVGAARGSARLNRFQEAVDTLAAALPVLDDGTYSPELAATLSWLAAFSLLTGAKTEAQAYTERCLIVAQALGLSDSFCQALSTRATSLMALDRFDEAWIHIEAAVNRAERDELPNELSTALINASDIAMTGDVSNAIDYARSGLMLSQRRGDRYNETIAATNLAYALLYRGDWAELDTVIADLLVAGVDARPQAEYVYLRAAMVAAWRGDAVAAAAAAEGVAPSRGIDSIDDACAVAMVDAVVAGAQGRYAEGLRLARSVVDRMRVDIGVRHETLRVTWVEAMQAALALGDLVSAEEMLAKIADLPKGLVPSYLRAEVARFTGRIAAVRGGADRAEESFADAERQLEALGYPYWLARARLDHAEWLDSVGREGASELAASAATVFAELRATAWAERARRLVDVPISV